MIVPKAVRRLTENLERLPGIGPRSAQRLAFYLLRLPQKGLDELSKAIGDLKQKTKKCNKCGVIAESEVCAVCEDKNRDKRVICVMEESLDVFALEQSGTYQGKYHVLGGVIAPLNNVGPDQLNMESLFSRIKKDEIREVILATNPTIEGEATAMYLKRKIENLKRSIKMTRLGQGMPIGGSVQFADEVTLVQAMEGRREF